MTVQQIPFRPKTPGAAHQLRHGSAPSAWLGRARAHSQASLTSTQAIAIYSGGRFQGYKELVIWRGSWIDQEVAVIPTKNSRSWRATVRASYPHQSTRARQLLRRSAPSASMGRAWARSNASLTSIQPIAKQPRFCRGDIGRDTFKNCLSGGEIGWMQLLSKRASENYDVG